MSKDEFSISSIVQSMAADLRKSARQPNILSYEPHEKQEIFHKSDKEFRLYIGGNRGGKTVGGATESIWWLTGRHPYLSTPKPPIRGRSVSVDFVNGVEAIVKPEIKRWLPPSELINGSWEDSYNSNTRTLTLANGSFLEFKSYDQDLDKHAGTSRHFIWFDEEPPHAIFDENCLRLADVGGKWWMTMTPVEGMTWVYDELYEPWEAGNNSDLLVVEVNIEDNPHVKKENVEKYTQFLSDEDKKARKAGKFVPSAGLAFPMYNYHNCVFAKLPFDLHSPDIRIIASLDLGINNPTAWLWHAVTPDGKAYTFHEMVHSDYTIPQWARLVLKWEKEVGIEPELRVSDPACEQRSKQTGLSDKIAYAQNGIFLAKANNEIHPGINKMCDYLNERKWFISDQCPTLHKQMKKLRWAEWDSRKLKDKNNRKEKLHKKDDHTTDSARYFFSFMPELKLDKQAKDTTEYRVAQMNAMLDAKQYRNRDHHTDPRFNQPKQVTEWTHAGMDETLGAEW